MAGYLLIIGLQGHQNLLKMPKYQQYIRSKVVSMQEIENAGLTCCHDRHSQNDIGNHKMLLLEKNWC